MIIPYKMTDQSAKRSKRIHMDIQCKDGISYIETVPDKTVDLVLTDPPYITSRASGMQTLSTAIAEANGKNIKTVEEWDIYKQNKSPEAWVEFMTKHKIPEDRHSQKMEQFKQLYVKYGHIFGKKYAVTTDYGSWDKNFTLEQLNLFVKHYFRVLKDGGVCIIWFDSWKIGLLAEMMRNCGFKQLRHIVWEKTNPQPLNSSRNLLTNALEFAVLGVKKSKPTFNSKYDSGVMRYPIQGGKARFHPTQKNTELFKELIRKFSNEGETVLDTFLGSGTTAAAAKQLGRSCIGTELNEEYFAKMIARLETI